MAIKSNFFASSVVRFAIFLFLTESIISLVFAVIGLLIFRGNLDSPSLPSDTENFKWWKKNYFFVYITYFTDSRSVRSVNCSNETFTPSTAVYRTYNWIIIYLLLSSMWTITSLVLFFAMPEKNKISKSIRSYFCCQWILVTTIVIFTDAYATVQYLQDLLDTSNIRSEFCKDFKKINVTNASDDSITPPVIMALIFSRGGIFWILNILYVLLITGILRSELKKERTASEHTSTINNNTIIEDTVSQISTTTTDVSSSLKNQEYIPWMNVFYIPSMYKEGTENFGRMTSELNDEHNCEHHYERVISSHDLPNPINIQQQTNTTDPKLYKMTEYYNLSFAEAEILKIECSNISIHVKAKIPRPLLSSSNHVHIPASQKMKIPSTFTTTTSNKVS